MGAPATHTGTYWKGRSWILKDGAAVDTVSDESDHSVKAADEATEEVNAHGDLTEGLPEVDDLVGSLTHPAASSANIDRHSPTRDAAFADMAARVGDTKAEA